MTLREAIEEIAESSTKNACKRPAMGGYIYRGEVSTETATAGDYMLTFKNRAGTEYKLDYDASAAEGAHWSVHSGSSLPTLSCELLEEMLGDDWMTGKASDFETARNPGQGDLW